MISFFRSLCNLKGTTKNHPWATQSLFNLNLGTIDLIQDSNCSIILFWIPNYTGFFFKYFYILKFALHSPWYCLWFHSNLTCKTSVFGRFMTKSTSVHWISHLCVHIHSHTQTPEYVSASHCLKACQGCAHCQAAIARWLVSHKSRLTPKESVWWSSKSLFAFQWPPNIDG